MKRNSNSNSGSEEGGQVGVVDLGLKLLNQDRSFSCNQTDISLRKPSSSRGGDHDDNDNDDDGSGGSSRVCGPPYKGYLMNNNNNNNMMMMNDIMSYHVSSASTGDSSSVHSSVIRPLQPLDVPVVYPAAHPLFRPSGEMATAAVGFPFTAAQWKELERQAMIYKYMVASIPVPPNLLYSATSTQFPPTTSYLLGKYGNGLNFRWVGNNKDAEPGRCRRTDGKKWRCSRDVAPNQKYCERHMHRGRPRSRKPVEILHHSDFPINKTNTTTNNTMKTNPAKKTRLNDPNPHSIGSSPSAPPSKGSTFYHPMASCAIPFDDSRSLAWNEEQQWQHLVQSSINPQVFQHQFEGEPVNLNTHINFVAKSDMGLFERPLIDAWSVGGVAVNKENCGSNKTSFSSSNINHGIDEMCQIHMGLGVMDPWTGTAPSPGGPLAEVLRPGSVTSDAGEGEFITPTGTTVSSPSGVLQKTLASFSDSSGSSSPTLHSSKGKSDMPFHWLN